MLITDGQWEEVAFYTRERKNARGFSIEGHQTDGMMTVVSGNVEVG